MEGPSLPGRGTGRRSPQRRLSRQAALDRSRPRHHADLFRRRLSAARLPGRLRRGPGGPGARLVRPAGRTQLKRQLGGQAGDRPRDLERAVRPLRPLLRRHAGGRGTAPRLGPADELHPGHRRGGAPARADRSAPGGLLGRAPGRPGGGATARLAVGRSRGRPPARHGRSRNDGGGRGQRSRHDPRPYPGRRQRAAAREGAARHRPPGEGGGERHPRPGRGLGRRDPRLPGARARGPRPHPARAVHRLAGGSRAWRGAGRARPHPPGGGGSGDRPREPQQRRPDPLPQRGLHVRERPPRGEGGVSQHRSRHARLSQHPSGPARHLHGPRRRDRSGERGHGAQSQRSPAGVAGWLGIEKPRPTPTP